MSDYLRHALVAEFLGTFTLVFVGGSAVALSADNGGNLLTSAIAFGLTLAALIYLWGSSSGAHFNPAVSLGFAVTRQMSFSLMISYWIAQVLGAIAAGALIAWIWGTDTTPLFNPGTAAGGASVGIFTDTDVWKAVFIEAILTFFLVMAYLFVYKNPMLALASGLIIGFVLVTGFIAGGTGTGASTNPARSLGTAIFTNNLGSYWIYLIGPIIGALVAALTYKLFTYDWGCCDKVDDKGCKVLDSCGNQIRECQEPTYDACGKAIVDCKGEPVMQTITKIKPQLTHMQRDPWALFSQWLVSKGLPPNFMEQELNRTVGTLFPEKMGMPPNPIGEMAKSMTQTECCRKAPATPLYSSSTTTKVATTAGSAAGYSTSSNLGETIPKTTSSIPRSTVSVPQSTASIPQSTVSVPQSTNGGLKTTLNIPKAPTIGSLGY